MGPATPTSQGGAEVQPLLAERLRPPGLAATLQNLPQAGMSSTMSAPMAPLPGLPGQVQPPRNVVAPPSLGSQLPSSLPMHSAPMNGTNPAVGPPVQMPMPSTLR